MKKTIALLLALIFTSVVLASCEKQEESKSVTDVNDNTLSIVTTIFP